MAERLGTGARAHSRKCGKHVPIRVEGLVFCACLRKGPAFALAGPFARYQAMYCFVLASYSSSVASRKPTNAPFSSRTA